MIKGLLTNIVYSNYMNYFDEVHTSVHQINTHRGQALSVPTSSIGTIPILHVWTLNCTIYYRV